MRAAPNRAKIVDMLGLLVRAPRTIAELSKLTGMDRTALHWWLRLMTEEGLLRREKVSRHLVYHWNSPPPAAPSSGLRLS